MIGGLKYAYGELLSDIAKPFMVGIFIAGIITFFFPDDITTLANEHQFLSMIIMLIAGIPMYVCATSSTPIAAALILKGLNPGAALVFLIAGPATNAATINIVKQVFNKRALAIYLSMIALCSIAFGFFVDWLYTLFDIQTKVSIGQASEIIPYHIRLIAALILTILLVYNVLFQLKHQSGHAHAH